MSAAWENLNFPTLTVYRLTCLVLQCTLDFRILFPFATCVFLILQVGQISVSFIDDQDLAGHGCPCPADVHRYVIFNWLQSTADQ